MGWIAWSLPATLPALAFAARTARLFPCFPIFGGKRLEQRQVFTIFRVRHGLCMSGDWNRASVSAACSDILGYYDTKI